eukprot:TRINITY_DN9283_c0_g1_i1.p3 TRINITY_DN9283_c0_g1~~TRINITY_DN9283_c0_g1_i1.p3  ORF type:complete len:235 (-),score=21.46 TRINITY_DN9283_c0_g1_i1:155-859(-)
MGPQCAPRVEYPFGVDGDHCCGRGRGLRVSDRPHGRRPRHTRGRGAPAVPAGGGGGRLLDHHRRACRGREGRCGFLRHLACPYCWKLANRWLEFRDPLRAAGVRGPLFVSVGNNDNLRAFLQANPHFPPDSVFVDTKDLAAYKAVGFKKLFEVTPKPTGLPGLSGDQWRTYLSNLQSLLPFGNERDPAAVSDGVRQLGGTFVLNGNDVIYGWADRVPGDDPDPTDVLQQAGIPL